MIHSAVKSAIARVEDTNGSHKGQAVVIGRGLAVTCAHVVTAALGKPSNIPISQKPETPVPLRFPNFDNAETTGRVVAWRPFDPDLTPGSDLALLEFRDLPGPGPEQIPFEPHFTDLPQQFDVVLLEYGAINPSGDIRFGKWVSTGETMLQMCGERFIENGVSGTAVTFPYPGRGLIGLAAGRPTNPGPDAHGYVIPARQIASLLEERACEIGKSSVASETDPPLKELKLLIEQLRVGTAKLQAFNRTQQIADAVEGALDLVEMDLESGLGNGLLSSVSTLSKTLEDTVRDCYGVVLHGQGADGSDIAAEDTFGPYRISRIASLLADLEKDERKKPRGMINNDVMDDTSAHTLSQSIRTQITTEIQALRQSPEDTTAPVRALARLDVRLRPKQIDPVDIRRSQKELSDLPNHFTRTPNLLEIIRNLQLFIGKYLEIADDLTVFRECFANDTIGPEMVIIPACPDGFHSGRRSRLYSNEQNEMGQKVNISERFALGRYQTTFTEFERYCFESESKTPHDENWGRGRRPVINVSWNEAKSYIYWINEQVAGAKNAPYRLPSETEWEYAARAGTNTSLPFPGNPMGGFNSQRILRNTTEVGSYEPNAFGLFDVIGNVWEWCEDKFRNDYSLYPNDGTANDVAPIPGDRSLRGGSWATKHEDLRVTKRIKYHADTQSFSIGFRIARNLPIE